MVRTPCCEKMGLNKGSWTPEEDNILISFIHKHGHPNWRALPKQAGLLRCGKSCRLRWINYLRPDIKRGNFTIEEEQIIINLHQTLGNRWAAIAAKLPGRTDNEIKNVWHAHLKKKLLLPNSMACTTSHRKSTKITPKVLPPKTYPEAAASSSSSPVSSDLSSVDSIDHIWLHDDDDDNEILVKSENLRGAKEEVQFQFPLFPDVTSSRMDDDIDFWCNLVTTDGGDLPEF